MLRVSKIISLESWLHFWFGIKTKLCLSPSTNTTREFTFELPSSVLWKTSFIQGGSRLFATEVNCFQLSIIVTKGSILNVGKGPCSVKLILFDKKAISFHSTAIHDGNSLHGNYKIIFTISASSLVLSS